MRLAFLGLSRNRIGDEGCNALAGVLRSGQVGNPNPYPNPRLALALILTLSLAPTLTLSLASTLTVALNPTPYS